jgi:hypothetical protein
MKVNAQSFFNFCAGHVPLLRQLAERTGELSEAEIVRWIQNNARIQEELPETTWRRLRELQILVPTEPGGSSYLLAEPVGRLLTYLFDEANPATPEMVRGYIASLEALGRKLVRAVETDDVSFVGLAFVEINSSLRRIHSDLEETQRAVQNEVAAFKLNRQQMSVRDRFQRIVYWMERFVEPLIEIVKPDGPMAAAFEETERLLRLAREESLFNDHPALERNLRYLRLVRQHALRVFQECRKELQPLYESLRRSSVIAAGAAAALERLMREGAASWDASFVMGLCQIRIQDVPGDEAIAASLRRVIEHPPEPAPVLSWDEEPGTPPALVRRLWLDQLPAEVESALPVDDLLGWLSGRYPAKSTSEIVAGFGRLLFHEEFRAGFREGPSRTYQTADGVLTGYPLRLETAELH